jgi:hypothetical protein
MIVAADRFGGRRAALAACSLLANLRYWSGCSQQLGVDRLRAVFSRPPGMDAGRASIVAARPAVKGS